MLSKKDFTKKFCEELLLKFGNKQAAAKSLAGTVIGETGKLVHYYTITRWLLESQALVEKTASVERLIEIISESTPVNPAFPLAAPARSNIIQFNAPPRILKKTWQCVVISDTQIGFLQDPETKAIEPIHDPRAIEIAQQIVSDVGPRKLAWIGDLMDWPFLSRWQQHDEFDAVNESIQAGYNHLCETIAAAGSQVDEKIMVGSNHAKRPESFLLEHNRKAMRIRRAADVSAWPVFSEPYLLRYEELGISFTGHYPGDSYYLLPDLLLTHAPPKAHEFQASVIHGHTHHLTRTTRVQHAHTGRQTYFVYDTGCLCQTGSTSNKHRLLRTLTPSDRARTDWAQGISVVNVVEGKFPTHSVDQISILDGKAIYNNQVYGYEAD